jgi:hypothetical protein
MSFPDAARRSASRTGAMRMAPHGRGDQNVGIEEDLHRLGLQNGRDPRLAHILNHAIPDRTPLRDALMRPQPVDLDHRWALLNWGAARLRATAHRPPVREPPVRCSPLGQDVPAAALE